MAFLMQKYNSLNLKQDYWTTNKLIRFTVMRN